MDVHAQMAEDSLADMAEPPAARQVHLIFITQTSRRQLTDHQSRFFQDSHSSDSVRSGTPLCLACTTSLAEIGCQVPNNVRLNGHVLPLVRCYHFFSSSPVTSRTRRGCGPSIVNMTWLRAQSSKYYSNECHSSHVVSTKILRFFRGR